MILLRNKEPLFQDRLGTTLGNSKINSRRLWIHLGSILKVGYWKLGYTESLKQLQNAGCHILAYSSKTNHGIFEEMLKTEPQNLQKSWDFRKIHPKPNPRGAARKEKTRPNRTPILQIMIFNKNSTKNSTKNPIKIGRPSASRGPQGPRRRSIKKNISQAMYLFQYVSM